MGGGSCADGKTEAPRSQLNCPSDAAPKGQGQEPVLRVSGLHCIPRYENWVCKNNSACGNHDASVSQATCLTSPAALQGGFSIQGPGCEGDAVMTMTADT